MAHRQTETQRNFTERRQPSHEVRIATTFQRYNGQLAVDRTTTR